MHQNLKVMSNQADNKEKNSEDSDGSKRDETHLRCFVLKHKWRFLLSVLFCFLIAFVYLWCATPHYRTFTKVLLKGPEPSVSVSSGHEGSSTQPVSDSNTDFCNGLEIFSTKTLSKKAVKALKLYVSYYADGLLVNNEIYGKDAPILIDLQEDMVDSLPTPIQLTLKQNQDSLAVSIRAENYSQQLIVPSLPTQAATPFGTLVIQRNPKVGNVAMEEKLMVCVRPLEQVAQSYSESLTVRPASKGTTIAELSFVDALPERAADFLNKLVELFNEDVNIVNNIEATRTRDFIDERLTDISRDLNATEAELKQYKRGTGMAPSYRADGTMDATQQVLNEQRLVEVGTQIDLINYLIEYCNDKHNEMQIVPANIGLINEQLNEVIAKYNAVITERNKLLREADAPNSTGVEVATREAESLYVTLRSSLQNVKNQAVSQRNDLLNQQSSSPRHNASSASGRALADINRMQEVKAGLYLMLLQKREENLLQLSSVSNQARQIEEPTVAGVVSPNVGLTVVIALLLGLLLPCLSIYMKKIITF